MYKHSAKRLLGAAALSSLILMGGSYDQLRAGTLIQFNDFSDPSELQLNGSAAAPVGGSNALRLTTATTSQAGSAFYKSAISLGSSTSFSTSFKFNISNSGGISDGVEGADGIVFVLQSNANTALGGAGGGIGYQGITNSLGVEFDTWRNGAQDDNNGNHVGINLNGSMDSVGTVTNVPTAMNNASDWWAWIDYNGLTDALEVRLAQTAIRPTLALLSYTVDLVGVVGTSAYAGFTSGTGAAFGNHDILAWRMEVPEPASLAIFGFGLAGLGFMRRRRAA